MNREPNFDGQDIGGGSTSDQFELIVAGWRAEGNVPQWPGSDGQTTGLPAGSVPPADAPADSTLTDSTPPDSTPAGTTPDAGTPADRVPTERIPVDPALVESLGVPPTAPQPAVAPEDEHFVPPEPPPLPRVGPPALVGAVLLAVGLVLVLSPGWLGLSDLYGLPLGLLALAAGLGWLVLRLWPDSLSAPDRDEDDDGAIL